MSSVNPYSAIRPFNPNLLQPDRSGSKSSSNSTAPASPNRPRDTVTLNTYDGNRETVSQNPDGSTSIVVTPQRESSYRAASIPASDPSQDSTSVHTISDGTEETITHNADGTYTLRFSSQNTLKR